MNRHRAQLFMLLGMWISFVALALGGSLLLAPSKKLAENSTAMLYQLALNDDASLSHAANVPEMGKVIAVDLDRMKLTLYENNAKIGEFDVLSKGREGTFWETPTGKYRVETKEPEHLSSIGGTWMPYSLEFYGNFFIHGWPTYQDGDPVPQGYSGGCIRLSTDDAKQVYDFADIGTRVIIQGGAPKDLFATSSRYYLRIPDTGDAAKLPDIAAPSFMVADIDSGTVFWERSANELKRADGLVSLASALTALETVDQYKTVRMSELLIGRSVLRKRAPVEADELPVGTLIYPLVFGGNDTAAKVFALEHGEKSFVKSMNDKAAAIGMANTSFSGPLSDDSSTTTAHDMLALLGYIDRSKHFLIDVSLASERTFVGDGTSYIWENKNPWILAGDASYQGGLVDQGSAKGSGAVIFSLPVSEFGNRRIAFVVLDSSDLKGDIDKLETFIEAHFVYGVSRDNARFVREGDEPVPSLVEKMKSALDLEKLLGSDIAYERDI